ncbi:glutaredoxin family protein [Priestia megaterium]|jgi:glutaredoxin-like protein NrdH|uniref:glutaredoxin family protein n=1 Tax=Priestia megaterium TaxID=1404 RepID=UPI002E1B851F|nr:glutaredoxin family protein [Priestia megaterium]
MEIIVFSTKNCGYCARQKEFLIKHNIKFEERDIHEDEEHYSEFKELGGLGTPFTIKKVSGEIVSKIMGFNEKQLLKSLI